MADGFDALTDRERQTLRLIVQGHDAKSIARHFDLSVHTINERLRDARRKLGVSSSREAARMLRTREGPHPETVGDITIGEAGSAVNVGQPRQEPARRRALLFTGAAVMSFALALFAIATVPQSSVAPPAASATQADTEVESAARQWLALVDAGRWEDSWRLTGAAFRALNTAAVWASASEKARTPLGAARSRTLVAQEDVPAPPQGYRLVKFRTSFANKPEAFETLTLAREDGGWRVTGVYIS